MANVRIDKVLQRIGGFGRWQRVQLTFLAPTGVFLCWLNLVYIFMASYAPVCDEHSNNASIGIVDQASINYTNTMEWHLYCTRKWLRSGQQICYAIGASMGMPIFYYVSNKYACKWSMTTGQRTHFRFGRKRPLLLAILLLTMIGSIAPYSQFYNLFCVFRFITGLLASAMRICALLLSLETASSPYHAWVLSIWDLINAIGYMLLSSIANVSENWRTIYIVATVPVFGLMIYVWLIPESPRWLLMIRRKADAERILRKIASSNGHILRHESVKHLTISEHEVYTYNNYTFAKIMRDWRMCVWFFELLMCWLLSFTAYFTFSFSIPSIGREYNKYLIFELHSWSGFVEILAIGIGLVAANFFRRKKICMVAAAVCGVLCAFTGILRNRSQYIPLAILALFARFTLVIYTSTLQILTLELFPKEIRFTILVIASSISHASIAFGAPLAITAEILPFLPYMATCGLAFIIFALTFLLPETFRRNIDDDDDQEQNISTIDPPSDPVIYFGGETTSAVEMIDLRKAYKSNSMLNEQSSIDKTEIES